MRSYLWVILGQPNPPASGWYSIADNEVYIDLPYYVNGNAAINYGGAGGSGLTLHFTGTDSFFYVNGDFKEPQANELRTDYTGFMPHNPATNTAIEYKETPYIYIDGKMELNGDSNTFIGYDDYAPTNVYCASLDAKGKLVVRGDIYTFDPNGESVSGQSGYVGSLYKWSASNVNITNAPAGSNVYGSWFSRGNVTIYSDGGKIEGDLRSEKDITLNGMNGFTVNGNLLCGGTLTINGPNVNVAGQVYAGKIIVNSGGLTGAGGTHTYEAINFAPTETYSGGGTKIGEKTATTTYSNVTFNVQDVSAPYSMNFHADYTRTTVTTLNGVASAPETESGTMEENDTVYSLPGMSLPAPPWYRNMTIQEYIDSGSWTKYTESKALYDSIMVSPTITTTEDILAYDIQSKLPASLGKIYPDDYTSANLKATIGQQTPARADYSSYYTDSSTFTTLGEEITSTGGFNKTNYYVVDNGTPTGDDDYYVIKASCVLRGITFDHNILIEPTADIRVCFEDCHMGSNRSIIVDDSSYQTTLYILKDSSLTFDNNGALVTKWYWDQAIGGAYYEGYSGGSAAGGVVNVKQYHNDASDPDYPNVIVQSDTGATLDMSNNNTFLTALVRAPQMKFIQNIGSQPCSFNYELANGSKILYGPACDGQTYATDRGMPTSKMYKTTIIGQLIAEDIEIINGSDFGMLFVEIPSTPVPPTPPTPGSTNPFAGESTVLFYDYY